MRRSRQPGTISAPSITRAPRSENRPRAPLFQWKKNRRFPRACPSLRIHRASCGSRFRRIDCLHQVLRKLAARAPIRPSPGALLPPTSSLTTQHQYQRDAQLIIFPRIVFSSRLPGKRTVPSVIEAAPFRRRRFRPDMLIPVQRASCWRMPFPILLFPQQVHGQVAMDTQLSTPLRNPAQVAARSQ
jgi:hypothetical protein